MSYTEDELLEQPLEPEQQTAAQDQDEEPLQPVATTDDLVQDDGDDDIAVATGAADDISDIEADTTNAEDNEPEDPAANDDTLSAEETPKEHAPAAAAKQLSAEELDNVADTAIETLRDILAYFDAGDVAVDEYEGEDNELILDAVGDNLAVLIGRYGKTLDSLQFLVAAIVNKKIGFRYPIVIDIEGYRNRRRQKLETMAKAAAARCIRSKAVVKMRPMTPYDRRIVHIILRNENRVFTESEGDEPNRYVLVKPC